MIGECVEAGVKGAIIISAGFKETGAGGVELERQVLEAARRGRMRIIGPNCLGVMSPDGGPQRHLRRRHGAPRQGRVPQPERGAAHGHPRLEPARARRLQRLRLDRLDARRRLGRPDRLPRRRPRTKSIVIYMESIGDARAFLSAAREVADQADHRHQGRPHRGGRQGGGLAHGLADRQRRGARRRLPPRRRAARDTIAELFYMAEVLGKQPRPRGRA